MRSLIAGTITTAIILALTSSCATAPKQTATPEQILNKAMGEGSVAPGKIFTLPGADRSDLPYVPVITPPEVARIWIYDHVTPSKDLVVGHWIFIKLSDEKWYIEEQWEDKPQKARRKTPLPPAEASAEKLTHAHGAQTPPQRQQARPSGQPGLTPVPPSGGETGK